MNIIKKSMISALIGLFVFGLTVSQLAFAAQTTTTTTTTTTGAPIICYRPTADGSGYTTEISYIGYCAFGTLNRPPMDCPNGTLSIGYENLWVCTILCPDGTTVSSFYGTPSCPTTTTSTTGINTSTTVPTTTTTTQIPYIICYNPNGTAFVSSYTCPAGTSTTKPPACMNYEPPQLIDGSWVCPLPPGPCFNSSGMVVTFAFLCPAGSLHTSPPICSDGLPTIEGGVWVCPTATTSSTTTTVATTTTTTSTLCNPYVNGTTQYPYSGSGSCHGHPDNDSSSGHVVRDQKWCRKHMTHFNSSGNHTHAYPHPLCM